MKRIEKVKSYTIATLMLSFGIHLITYLALFLVNNEKPAKVQDTIEFVVVENTPQPQEQKIVQQKKKLETKDIQVVEQNEKSINDEIPEDQFFLSRKNQTVKEQTKARHHGDFKNDAGKGQNGKAKQDKAKKKKMANKKRKKAIDGVRLKNLLPQHSYSSAKNFEVNEATAGQRSQSNDYLKGIKEGKQTVLNTREFVYYAYYERIRGKIRKYWEPVIKDKVKHVFETGRKLASVDHKTAVVITLDKHGSLVNVQVRDGSGVRDLDDAAVEAFKEAEPFPNPPDGIIENDGKIRINWNFVLEA